MKICPASLSLQCCIFFFSQCLFPALQSPLFFCNSGSGYLYFTYIFSSDFKPASRHLTSRVACSDPWIPLQWVLNTHPAVYWFLNSSGSLALLQAVFCSGQALFLVCLIFTLKCLINTLLKEAEKNPPKPLQALSTHTLPMRDRTFEYYS